MQLMEQFQRDIEMSGLKPYTCKGYLSTVSIFLKSLTKAEDEVTLQDVQEFLRCLRYEKKLTIGTVNNYRSGIKFLFEVTLDRGWNDRKIPRIRGYRPVPLILCRDEMERLFDAAENMLYKTILVTIYGSGLRIGEAVSLKVRDIDSQRMQVHIREGKNGNARMGILSQKSLDQLRNYIREWKCRFGYRFLPDDPLFPSPIKNESCLHISSASVEHAVREAAEKAGITKHVTAHTMRHSFATHLLEAGESIFVIKQLLGHQSIGSTCVYLQLVDISQMGVKSPLDM
jgi:integrase/recombinase XerD